MARFIFDFNAFWIKIFTWVFVFSFLLHEDDYIELLSECQLFNQANCNINEQLDTEIILSSSGTSFSSHTVTVHWNGHTDALAPRKFRCTRIKKKSYLAFPFPEYQSTVRLIAAKTEGHVFLLLSWGRQTLPLSASFLRCFLFVCFVLSNSQPLRLPGKCMSCWAKSLACAFLK